MNKTVCIPIDKRNECREKRHPGHECGGGIGKDGDPMYSLTASMGGHFEPYVCLWEEEDEESDSFSTSFHGASGEQIRLDGPMSDIGIERIEQQTPRGL